MCDENGCLYCEDGYLTSRPKIIGNLSYYECYDGCPNFLSFIINGSICS